MTTLRIHSAPVHSRPLGTRPRGPLAVKSAAELPAASAPKASPEPPPAAALLVLRVGETWYTLAPIAGIHAAVARRAYHLTKLPALGDSVAAQADAGRTVYAIRQLPSGWHDCTCPDFEFRQRRCKHIRAMVDTGILDREPTPPQARSAGEYAAQHPIEAAADWGPEGDEGWTVAEDR